ncbi:MAG: IS5/IS1182 family transposase, partial [Alphaproteobacteria bacterium CG_4_10_14_0_8_um_filter_37_21]
MAQIHRRHDISDKAWFLLEPHLPGKKGSWGGVATNNRQFINAVFWILRTGAPWRDLPPDYGDWKNTHRRFCRWRDKGVWEGLLEILVNDPDYEWIMIDATHVKVHPHAAGAVGGNQDMTRFKRGLNTKVHMAVDAHGMPIRMLITDGTTADCTQAEHLIKGINPTSLLADKAYDTDAIIQQCQARRIDPVIPSKKNRKVQRAHDVQIYKSRHLVENAFLHLKRWRGLATRYAKNTS